MERTPKDVLNHRLKAQEFEILELKHTEPPGTGEYLQLHEEGSFFCRRCNSPLYSSEAKFDSRCGWPSFDDEIPDRVMRKTDKDGRRTEILCASCGGHLGHVFSGEGFTPKNTRHCVNSLSLRFVPSMGETGRALFAGGCFWGLEYFLSKEQGVFSATSGYTGGDLAYPEYKQVCSHQTGHLEAVEVLYDPKQIQFEALAKLFFEIHDPEQTDGQGPDRGPQYLSALFYENPWQKSIAEKLMGQLKDKGFNPATRLLPASAFWPAEDYHQQYYDRKGSKPYCHGYTKRF